MRIAIGIVVVAASLAHASTILLDSGVSPGGTNNITTNNVVLSDVEPKWTQPVDGADWISYINSGWNTITNSAVTPVQDATSLSTPTAVFTQTFTDNTSPLNLSITVWADDSAVVFLDGTQISLNASLTQTTGIYCAPTGITCDGPGSTFTMNNLAAGTHTLTFDVYQAGGGSFGLMYAGTVTDNAQNLTPEPGSYVLLGAGLMALALFRVKRAF
jgi:hypothetical protein